MTDCVTRYKKEIPESECTVVTPMSLGGFRSEGYLAVNPQGKVPSLKCQTTGQVSKICACKLHAVVCRGHVMSSQIKIMHSTPNETERLQNLSNFLFFVILHSSEHCGKRYRLPIPSVDLLRSRTELSTREPVEQRNCPIPRHVPDDHTDLFVPGRSALWDLWDTEGCPQRVFQTAVRYCRSHGRSRPVHVRKRGFVGRCYRVSFRRLCLVHVSEI